MQWCENSPDPCVPRWKIPGASAGGHQSKAPLCSHCLQAGESLEALGGAAAALPGLCWELGWAGLGIAGHPSCTFKSRAFGLWGFYRALGREMRKGSVWLPWLRAPGHPGLGMAAWLWLSLSEQLLPASLESARAPEERLTRQLLS